MGERDNHIATVEPSAPRENYSLLIRGDSSGDGDGGGVDGDGFRGHFPVPAACRNRDFCPPILTSRWWRLRDFSWNMVDSPRVFTPKTIYRRRGGVRGQQGRPHPRAARPPGVGPLMPPCAATPPIYSLTGENPRGLGNFQRKVM